MSVQVSKVAIQAPEFRSAGPQPNLKGVYPSLGKLFVSEILTATGSSQDVAHGLGAVPAKVVVVPYDNTVLSITEGSHDDTNIKVTLTGSAKFKVIAYL